MQPFCTSRKNLDSRTNSLVEPTHRLHEQLVVPLHSVSGLTLLHQTQARLHTQNSVAMPKVLTRRQEVGSGSILVSHLC